MKSALAIFPALLLITAVGIAEEAKNLFKDPTQKESWRLEEHDAGKGTLKVEEGVVAIHVSAVSDTDWHVQASLADLDLTEGAEYELSFEGKADTASRLIKLNMMIDEEDWHDIGMSEELFLGKEFKKVKLTFQATGVLKGKNRLSVVVGQKTGAVYLKDVQLIEKKS